MTLLIDLTGKRLGRWTVLRRGENSSDGKVRWECRCECGESRLVERSSLRSGDSQSCGCLQREIQSKRQQGIPGAASRSYVLHQYKASAKNRHLSWTLTEQEFDALTQGSCVYCGIAPSTVCRRSHYGDFIYNGIDRIDNALGYTILNVAPCCFVCNQAKHDMPEEAFRAWIQRLVDYHS